MMNPRFNKNGRGRVAVYMPSRPECVPVETAEGTSIPVGTREAFNALFNPGFSIVKVTDKAVVFARI
jgi:predicted GNAT superfamily acetyltransferase